MWAVWFHHSWRSGHAAALREVGFQMPKRGSKTSMVLVIWENLEYFRRDQNDFMSRLVTMDETWLYHYDPESTQQSMKWRHSGSPQTKKKNWGQNPTGKVIALTFCDQDGIFLIDYLSNGQTINVEYYLSVLIQLSEILKEKRHGKFTKWVLSFHDNEPAKRALTTQKKQTYMRFQRLDHLPCSTDLGTLDFNL